MSPFAVELDVRAALALYLELGKGEGLRFPEAEKLSLALRAYLYERLTIEEMEEPERSYAALAPKARTARELPRA